MIRKNLIYIVVIAAGLVAAVSAGMERNRQVEQSQTATSTVIVATSTVPTATSTTGTTVSPVTPATSTKPVTQARCYVGGCSGQICSDQPDMVSTCEYREAYGCYKSTGAKCERQSTGQCGWTQTTELAQCIQKADAAGAPRVY